MEGKRENASTSASRSGLLKAVEDTSKRLVKCAGCTKCCEKGIAYVLPEEEKDLKALNVPLLQIDGITFIERRADGSCAMLDKANGRCSIYEDRPFCCRAFPLDVFSRRGRLEWGVYTYCPPERVLPIATTEQGPTLDSEVVLHLATSVEKQISATVLNYLAEEDQVVAQIEILDEHKDDYVIVGEVLNQLD